MPIHVLRWSISEHSYVSHALTCMFDRFIDQRACIETLTVDVIRSVCLRVNNSTRDALRKTSVTMHKNGADMPPENRFTEINLPKVGQLCHRAFA